MKIEIIFRADGDVLRKIDLKLNYHFGNDYDLVGSNIDEYDELNSFFF